MDNDTFNNKVIENLTVQKANLDLENTKLKVLVDSLQTDKQNLESELEALKSEKDSPSDEEV